MKRFVPAELHGFLDYTTLGMFTAGGKIFRVKDAPGSQPCGRCSPKRRR